ncbi:MAG TPA: phosphotransferase [Glaciibacter sp.]|nr:phosphotransferase [Glaciibacter sp.]
MAHDTSSRKGVLVDHEAAPALREAVSDALGRHVTALQDVRREPLEYDAFLAHRAVNRLRGSAIVDGVHVPWSLIEKQTEGPGLASPYLLDNGRREFEAYLSGLLDDIAPGIRAPRSFGALPEPDGRITLWLEEIHHEGSRPLDAQSILTAAGHLGGLAGRWYGRELAERWLFSDWIERHGQSGAVGQGLATLRRRHPHAVARLGGRLALAEQLILGQARLRENLESLPHTLCHHDAVGANVFSTVSGTVLIDWESVGPGPVGADLASLLFSSVRRGDASVGVVVPIVEDALHAYAEGLRAEGADVKFEDVRRGFEAAIALRWKLAVDVVAGIERGEAPRRGSLPDEAPEEAMEELIPLVDLLLASAQRVLE